MPHDLAIKVNTGIVFAPDARPCVGADYFKTGREEVQFTTETKRIHSMLFIANRSPTQAVQDIIEQVPVESGEQTPSASGNQVLAVVGRTGAGYGNG